MDILKYLEATLFLLSNLVIYPVIIALLFLLIRTIFASGTTFREFCARLNAPGAITKTYAAEILNIPAEESQLTEIELNHILEKARQRSFQKIQASRYSVKMGPTLGLIGTLTPMARALSGLSQGNLSSLSTQMITAFSTTVIGLVVGGIAYSLMHIQLRWQREDMYELSKLAEEKLAGAIKTDHAN